MRIGVIGASGQLGSELVKREDCYPIEGRLFQTGMAGFIQALKPGAIINCAAMTNVDGCEFDVKHAFELNTLAVQWLDRVYNGYLIHLSTDYIFDGGNGPYLAHDKAAPLSIYGWSKLGGELVIKQRTSPSLIVRTTILFSEKENNFVVRVLKQLKAGEQVRLYEPTIMGTPTYVPALAKEIVRLARNRVTGIVHVAGDYLVTRMGFARAICRHFGYNGMDSRVLVAISDIQNPYAAPRPQVAGLTCDHSGGLHINTHSVEDSLAELAAGPLRHYQKEIV